MRCRKTEQSLAREASTIPPLQTSSSEPLSPLRPCVGKGRPIGPETATRAFGLYLFPARRGSREHPAT